MNKYELLDVLCDTLDETRVGELIYLRADLDYDKPEIILEVVDNSKDGSTCLLQTKSKQVLVKKEPELTNYPCFGKPKTITLVLREPQRN